MVVLVASTLPKLVNQKNRCVKIVAQVVMGNLQRAHRCQLSAKNVQQDNFRKPLEHQTSTPVVNARLDFHKNLLVEHIVCLVSQEHFPLVQALNNARNVLLATKGHPMTTQQHVLNALLVGIKILTGKLHA
jgi:hypothetical protein